ncbi:MAG: glycosyltransferase family 39 protein, partial [Candidatus Moranbacteria bacterium]|nr:glycosyltransferase family 39 protein [Candidatus Moranbacteria bacterium]
MNKEFFQKNWHYWILALIILVTMIYRGWNFEDWMLFRADQARDAHYAKEAIEEGAGNLRLLGPRAGAAVYLEGDESLKGDVLRLGPIYYYFQYLSALVFGGASAWTLAMPDFLLSLIAIGIFYLILRQFFSISVSLATTAVFAFSFILLEYSRFAWNTNQLVFWECLLVLALIKIIILENRKKAGIWLIILGLSIAILSQLHFLALFGFGAIILVSLIVYRPWGINWKFWLASAAVVAVIYLPVIAADFKNDGDNIRRLAGVIGAEDEEPDDEDDDKQASGVESFLKISDRHGKYYSLILSSINRHEVENISKLGIIFILGGLGLALFHFFRKRVSEGGFGKKLPPMIHPLIFVTFLWFVIFFAIYFKILPRIGKVRYWLMIAPLVFIFLAYWLAAFELIKNKIIKNGLIIGCTLTLV